MAAELHAQELDIWTNITANLNNTTKTLKHITLPQLQLKLLPDKLLLDKLLPDKLLLDRKLLVDEDKPLYALHFLRSLTKQKKKRRHSKHRRRSRPTHLQMLLRTFTTP